jgi:hypothetical protein
LQRAGVAFQRRKKLLRLEEDCWKRWKVSMKGKKPDDVAASVGYTCGLSVEAVVWSPGRRDSG